MTGNVELCDESEQEACYENPYSNSVLYSPYITEELGKTEISNGF